MINDMEKDRTTNIILLMCFSLIDTFRRKYGQVINVLIACTLEANLMEYDECVFILIDRKKN